MYNFIIYKATNLKNNKVYIGLTSQALKKRVKQHFNKANYNSNTYFLRSLKKHGFENFIWEEIAWCKTKSDAAFVEQFNICLYQSYIGSFGYNLTLGGEGTLGLVPWNKGKPILPHVLESLKKNRVYAPNKGNKHSIETRKIMSFKVRASNKKRGHGSRKGMKNSTEMRKKLSLALKGQTPWNKNKKMTQEYCESNRNGCVTNKKLIAIDLNSGFPLYFNSIKEASIVLKIQRKSIQRIISGDIKVPKKFNFILETQS